MACPERRSRAVTAARGRCPSPRGEARWRRTGEGSCGSAGTFSDAAEGGPVTNEASAPVPELEPPSSRLALLLAAAMFVLVVDTSLMNVSISAVVDDLDTTVSGVQSAIALEALVSAAFILIGSKVGDLI